MGQQAELAQAGWRTGRGRNAASLRGTEARADRVLSRRSHVCVVDRGQQTHSPPTCPRGDTRSVNRPRGLFYAYTGTPNPADERPLIWERLYRVDRSRARASGGAGIGLAIVREIVEGQGGSVGASSEDGRTAVWFRLPKLSGA